MTSEAQEEILWGHLLDENDRALDEREVEGVAACPFCGSLRYRVKPVWKTYRFVACLDCKAGGPVCRTDDEAIEAWNRRVSK